MSEHVTQLVLMMDLTKLIQTPTEAFISQIGESARQLNKRMTFMLPL